MVKKANGKWQICIDYIDLNRVCPKDTYPLPNINKLVDEVSEFRVLSFLDAYFGYNQVQMHTLDEEKMTFITEDANFWYRCYIPKIDGSDLQTTDWTKCRGFKSTT